MTMGMRIRRCCSSRRSSSDKAVAGEQRLTVQDLGEERAGRPHVHGLTVRDVTDQKLRRAAACEARGLQPAVIVVIVHLE
jgi:hypothetical protein